MNQVNGEYERPESGGFAQFLRVLQRRWLVVLLPLLLVPVIAAVYSLRQEKQYQASASLLFRSGAGTDTGGTSADEERQSATNVSLASLGKVSELTARSLGGSLTAGDVRGSVSVSATSSVANVLVVRATSSDPNLARRIANAYASNFVDFRRSADKRTAAARLDTARRRIQLIDQRLSQLGSPVGLSARRREERSALLQTRNELSDKARELDTQRTLATGDVEIADVAGTPSSPSSPKPARTAMLGLGFGLLLGIALAVLFEVLDRRLRDPKEIEAILRRPTLGAIPLSPAFSRNGRRPRRPSQKLRGLRTSDMEAFHMLRANLRYFDFDQPVKSVVVTSAAPGEGKSTVAWNLTAAGANAGLNALLVEAELRKPTLVSEFNMPDGPGLSDLLLGDADARAVTQRFAVASRPEGDAAAPAMDVIIAGRRVPNPADLLDSRRMEQLIRQAEQRYDLVVIDTPPMAVVADAIPLLNRAGGVLIVSRLGETTREAAEHLRTQLEGLNARTLGVVINGISSQDGYYGSAYGYAEQYGSSSSAR